MKQKKEIEKLVITDPVVKRTKKVIMTPQGVVEEEFVICKVCGHPNPSATGVCEMCSNYLY